ncbi:MAG: DsbA family protein [Candidatus Omnitrophica bacterium]|nr:DsbA family protein [Candidatus Omnitrophota bacterium]
MMRAQRGGLVGVALSLAGIGVCGYLAFIHVALMRGELFGGAACGAEGSIFNCHAVTASSFGSVFGVPLALWGLIGYLATLSLAFIAWQFPDWAARALALLAGVSLLFVTLDLVLLAIMLTQIHYLCPLCLATYLVNLLLLLSAKWASTQPWGALLRAIPQAAGAFLPQPRVAVVWVFWGVVLTGTVGTLASHAAINFAAQGDQANMQKQMAQYIKNQRPVSVSTTGDPVLGPSGGSIQLIEFSDFLCPVCQRASRFNPILLATHQRQTSFVFKHFPLDQECNATVKRTLHNGACRIAAATECAHEQGKFWPFHDRIFRKGSGYKPAELEADARGLGLDMAAYRTCMGTGRGMEAVKRDIEEHLHGHRPGDGGGQARH